MTSPTKQFAGLMAILLLSLNGCGLFDNKLPPPPPPPEKDMRAEIAIIRDRAQSQSGTLEINPVRDVAVVKLVKEAEQQEATGHLDAALILTERAWKIEKTDPHVLQYMAELHLQLGHFLEAESFATRSYDASAQIGPMCLRSWLTIAQAREATGRLDAANAATERAKTCVAEMVHRY
jgi:tetratricopeptide (TPR) repeat protein